MLRSTGTGIGAAIDVGRAWMGLKAYMTSSLPLSSLVQIEEHANPYERLVSLVMKTGKCRAHRNLTWPLCTLRRAALGVLL